MALVTSLAARGRATVTASKTGTTFTGHRLKARAGAFTTTLIVAP